MLGNSETRASINYSSVEYGAKVIILPTTVEKKVAFIQLLGCRQSAQWRRKVNALCCWALSVN